MNKKQIKARKIYGHEIMKTILLFVALCFLSGCTKHYRLVDQNNVIRSQLHASNVIEVQPPIGPFNLIHQGERYFKAESSSRTYYIKTKSSWANVAIVALGPSNDQLIDVYVYYREVLGVYVRVDSAYHNRYEEIP